MTSYPVEILGENDDDGTMPNNVAELAGVVVGHRIVSVENTPTKQYSLSKTVLTLDDGRRVNLLGELNCCAYTEVKEFLLHPEMVDHVITGVGTTAGYTTWHIYADYGDILELTVDWSCGNPFYYGYGFTIQVEEISN